MTEKYMIKMKKQLAYLLLAATSLCLWSCSNDDGEAPQLKGTETQVPITITFGEAWDTDNAISRVAPPEQGDGLVNSSIDEIEDIDRVRIITFRRKDASVAGTASGQFVYDPTNDVVTTCEQEDTDARKEAHAQLVKAYGYEYRVVAIAYPSAQEGWFDLNTNLDGLTFDEFEMTIKGQETSAAGDLIAIKILIRILNFTKTFLMSCSLPTSSTATAIWKTATTPSLNLEKPKKKKPHP